jgi:hypothetical protein
MPIIAIIQEPGSNVIVDSDPPNPIIVDSDPGSVALQDTDIARIVAAYRPVIFKIKATRTDGKALPPVVYCDIYFNDIFYKSLSSTQYSKLNSGDSEWTFDIADACQEFLSRDLPISGGSDIYSANQYVTKTFCRFRSSGIDANNFISPEDISPVQGTGSLAPVSGSGLESTSFMIINATLQHDQNQELLTHLQYSIKNGVFDADAYPLTHRPSPYRICKGDSDYFPFLYMGDKPFLKVCISYKLKGQDNFTQVCYAIPQTCDSEVSNVLTVLQPNNDIKVSFDSTAPATDFEYKIDNGSWLIVPSDPFTVKFNQLLMYLITEAGEQVILDQQGNIIIPQDVVVFDVVHTITIRPRCANGIYGAGSSADFTVPSTPQCDPPVLFQVNAVHILPQKQIVFDLQLPGGKTNFQLEWKFDYGNGFVSPYRPIENYVLVGAQFTWNIPDGYPSGGKFIFHVRTKCSDTSFSQWSADINVNYIIPLHNVNLILVSITNDGAGNYDVFIQLSEPVSDDITARGYFQADRSAGAGTFISTFGFAILIAAGLTDGHMLVPGAAGGGSADMAHSKIEVVNPNPTSGGQQIIF